VKEIKIGDKLYDLGKKTLIMGILNVTPDSFYDGGRHDTINYAIKHAIQMEKDGADIIDIGGESTKPGSVSVPLSVELARVIPVVEELIDKIKIPISVDTYKSEIAKKAVEIGAVMINDITALRMDKQLATVVAEHDVPIVLMHMQGTPTTMQFNPKYEDVMYEIKNFLKIRVSYAISCGVKKENIIVDPGIGFGKRTGEGIEDNCEIIKRLGELKELEFPILVGVSRKAFIGNISNEKKPLSVSERLEGSLAAAVAATINGANIIRVHDVKETRKCLNVVDCIVRQIL
jgi:dihydropteroate synthase